TALGGRSAVLAMLLAAVVVVSAALSPFFLQTATLTFVLQYMPVLGVLGLAQMAVMMGGGPGIDLSLGGIMSLTGLSVAALLAAGVPVVAAGLIGLALGAALGAVNGAIIAVLGVDAFMATLATMLTYGGLAVALTGGAPIGGVPQTFAALAQGTTWLLPNHVLFVFVPVAVALHVVLRHSRFGAHVIAAGSAQHAAYRAGVSIVRVRFCLYMASGAMAAVAGIMQLAWFQTARPDAGLGMELLSVTVAVLGGTHILGGMGSVLGVVLAVLVVTTLQAGLQLANISQAWQLGTVGVLLIASAVADRAFMARLSARPRPTANRPPARNGPVRPPPSR
ncbi:MAG: ABC transporter permease, partial [Pseudomonadota bacterium]